MKERYCSLKCSIFSRVSVHGDGCHLWTGGKSTAGYGSLRFRSASYRAHRAAFEIAYGSIPEGKIINHHCDNPLCVNPDHLYAGTNFDNTADMDRRNRRGIIKLSPQEVVSIKWRLMICGDSLAQISRDHGVTKSNIACIGAMRNWTHIPWPGEYSF